MMWMKPIVQLVQIPMAKLHVPSSRRSPWLGYAVIELRLTHLLHNCTDYYITVIDEHEHLDDSVAHSPVLNTKETFN
jgi:hypothetical protein